LGSCGFLFGVLSYRWNRRESRLEALSKILQPLTKAAQHLHEANGRRRRCEHLRFSFPNADPTSEAAQQINRLITEYGEDIKASHDDFRLAESEFASRSFRFPDKISRLVQKARDSLSEFGRLVNEGLFDKADLQFIKFRDDYGQISRVGRGWRLADPFEGLKRHFRREKTDKGKVNRYDLSEKDMHAIMELVQKRATTQARNTFTVHPPKKLLDHPEIAKSERVIEDLEDSIFSVVFQDGTAKMMTLVELMVFTYNLIILAQQYAEVSRMMEAVEPAQRAISVTVRQSIDEIMRPEMVRFLLERISFAETPSDTGGDED
jgi:hypothetical protein